MIFNIQNENNTYKKISIVSKNSLGRIFLPIPGPIPGPYNPTLTLNQVDERDVLNVCLAPLSNISCEGATDFIYFPSFGGDWNIELDGVLHTTDGSRVAPYIRANLSSILHAGGDGGTGIGNLDSVNHRIKLIPLNNPSYPNEYSTPVDNPTFTEHEDGSLTFCLAPVV